MLRDHFRPPLSDRFGWEAVHGGWAYNLAEVLNDVLPEGWRAAPHARFGIEIDVGTYDERSDGAVPAPGAVEPLWEPAAPTLTLDFPPATDAVEVRVLNFDSSPNLVGAVEFVSPRNKDRPEARDAFAAKCETILRDGAGLVIVDTVTVRRSNLHRELLDRLGADGPAACSSLYVTAYHPHGPEAEPRLDVWEECLGVGDEIPAMPLFLRLGPRVKLDLAAAYERTCRGLRVPEPGGG